ncbi:CheR family methyltransferase [Faucicola mancuniensis]|uniref:CheR family methyltransferase n=1 Tax=Faucicola mancuniensis TaxID=1309795 RepID=UPI00397778B4
MIKTYRLSQNELTMWLKYIEHQVGFVLPSGQLHWVKSVIERHLQINQLSNTDFLEKIAHDDSLYHQLFDDILIPRTEFFRHIPTFEFIENYAKHWQNLEQQNKQSSPFTAWSVGCSTGQEAVSLLLTLAPVLRQRRDFLVYGSDFRQQSLQFAKKGEYDIAELLSIPKVYQQDLDIHERHFCVKPQERRHLQFFSKNLVDYEQAIPILKRQCQVIICKNVLIYFRQFEQRDIVHYLSQFLADDGVLLLGAGELTRFQTTKLVRLPQTAINGFCKPTAPDWLKQIR